MRIVDYAVLGPVAVITPLGWGGRYVYGWFALHLQNAIG